MTRRRQSVLGGGGGTPTNDVVEGAFTLTPARGVLSGEGSATFTVTYAPRDLARTACRAVMMLRNVPLAAYPAPGQELHLARLAEEGHGPWPRLRSWLDQLSQAVHAPVPEEDVEEGAPGMQTVKTVSLYALLELAEKHVSDPTVMVLGVGQLKQRLRRLLGFVGEFRLCELDVVPVEECDYVTVYNWNGNKGLVVAEVQPLPLGPDYSAMDEELDLTALGLAEPEEPVTMDVPAAAAPGPEVEGYTGEGNQEPRRAFAATDVQVR